MNFVLETVFKLINDGFYFLSVVERLDLAFVGVKADRELKLPLQLFFSETKCVPAHNFSKICSPNSLSSYID